MRLVNEIFNIAMGTGRFDNDYNVIENKKKSGEFQHGH